jgi:predicted Zn finger-like uncharacterized protein
MILECPSCQNRYLVDPRAIGKAGRTVRCAKCKNQWFAEPPAKEPEADVISVEEAAETRVEPRPIPQGSSVPAIREEKVTTPLWLELAAVAAFVLFAITAALYFRPLVVEAMPGFRGTYAALGMYDSDGVVFANLEYAQSSAVSKDSHRFSGYLVNTSTEPRRLPVISIALFNKQGDLLRRSRIREEGTLAAGGQQAFTHELTASPESVGRIVLESGSPFELKLR